MISNENPIALTKFIGMLKEDNFSNLASCSFAIYQNKGIDIKQEKMADSNSFVNTEILRCRYNNGYNFGTFQIAINRFINNLRFIELPYSINYLEDNSTDNGFIWINNFYSEDYQDLLLNSWLKNEDSFEVKNEFSQNATCIESNKFKSFKLI